MFSERIALAPTIQKYVHKVNQNGFTVIFSRLKPKVNHFKCKSSSKSNNLMKTQLEKGRGLAVSFVIIKLASKFSGPI
jgi:hypothetical protein